jgi:UDP-glucose 4-epimerase
VKKKTILVTGAAGYVGSVCVETLLDMGYAVVALDNLQGGKREAVAPSALFVQLDLCHLRALGPLFQSQKIDAVMHFAARADVGTSVRQPHCFFKNNIIGTLNLLDAMLSSQIRDLIFSSSASIYGEPRSVPIEEDHPKEPLNAYGESKLAIERLLAWYWTAYGLRSVSLRYFNAAGATAHCGEDRRQESHLVPCLLDVALDKAKAIPIFGNRYPTKDGTCVRDFVHVRDIIAAHVLCLEHLEELGCEAFNVGQGVGYTVLEVVNEARHVTGHPIPFQMSDPRPGDPAVLVASSQKLSKVLGWRPQRSDLRTILEDAWTWRVAHPHGYPPRGE